MRRSQCRQETCWWAAWLQEGLSLGREDAPRVRQVVEVIGAGRQVYRPTTVQAAKRSPGAVCSIAALADKEHLAVLLGNHPLCQVAAQTQLEQQALVQGISSSRETTSRKRSVIPRNSSGKSRSTGD